MWPSAEIQALLTGAVRLEAPWALTLGAAIVVVIFAALLRGPTRIPVPGARHEARSRLPSPDIAWLLSVGIRGAALSLVLICLARPVALVAENPAGGDGIDLVIALDASGSMNALDAQLDGRRVTRLELAKRVVSDFISAREGDRIGLVVFGDRAYTQSPLSVDHRLVLESLARVDVGLAGDATALGEAIGLGTRRLEVSGAPQDSRRTLILFTDGRHNAGRLAPRTAAQIARLHRVRIYAVGIGSSGIVPFAQKTPGEPLRFEKVDLDEETLRAVASSTGGRFFHARHPGDLGEVAAAIDALEVRPSPSEPRYRRASLAPLALAAALGALLLEALTAHALLRRLP